MVEVLAKLHDLEVARETLLWLLPRAPRSERIGIIERLAVISEEIHRGRELILRLTERPAAVA